MSAPLPAPARPGFTLLEVIVALGILSLGLLVLVDTQATAVTMTTDMGRTTSATFLAQEKMTEAVLRLESEGWSSQDIEEDGDFEGFGDEEFRGDSLHLDNEEELSDFKWAYTVRQIDLSLPDDVWGMAGDLAGNGYWGEEGEGATTEQAFDLSSFGVSSDMITEYLADYIREVRVIVWWGKNEDQTDQVEIVHHVINPSGVVTEADAEE